MLESEMVAAGNRRAAAEVRRAYEGGLQNSDFGSRLLGAAFDPFHNGFKEWMSGPMNKTNGLAHSFLSVLPSECVCVVASKVIFDTIGSKATANKVAFNIAKAIEIEMAGASLSKRGLRFAKKMAPTMKLMKVAASKTQSEISVPDFPDAVRLQAGLLLLMLFEHHTGLIVTMVSRISATRVPRIVFPSVELIEWIEEAIQHKGYASPMYGAMSEPPAPWVSQWEGGYRSLRKRGLVKGECPTFDASAPWVQAVNKAQEQEWRVDTNLLKYLTDNWNEPEHRQKLGLSTKISDASTSDSLLRNSVLRHRAWSNRQNIYDEQRLITSAAACVHGGNRIWYPWFVDFRGRMYPIPPGLQPQGSDLSKALLQFAKPEPVDLYEWFEFGRRLLKTDPRMFHNNWDGLLESFPSGLSEPIRALGWALETRRMSRNHDWNTGVVVSIDGRCNGLQMISLISGDESLASAVNVIGDGGDIYTTIGERVGRAIALSSDPIIQRWFALNGAKFPRELSKAIVMIIPYGATAHSIREIITEYYDDLIWGLTKGKHQRENVREAISGLSKIYFDELQNFAPNCKKILDWFKTSGKLLAQQPITWLTPSGFNVVMMYRKASINRVSTIFNGSLKRSNVRVLGEISPRTMSTTFLPNFVHSMDASIAHLVRTRFPHQLVTVHDSFGTTSNRIKELKSCLRSTVMDVFASSPLEQFRDRGIPIPEFTRLEIGTKMYE